MLYIDSDTLFFDAPEDLWENFKRMDSEQMIGMVEEAPYSTFYKAYYKLQPLIGKYGAWSGNLLLNLTRMRDFGWLNKLIEIHDYYTKNNIQYYFDQGLINILLTSYPGKVSFIFKNYKKNNSNI